MTSFSSEIQIHVAASRAAAVPLPRNRVALAIAAIALGGLALRLAAGRGPLWIDEIWSLMDLQGVDRFTTVLWGLSIDNNHFLNSLWLYFVWPISHESIWLRLPGILAGTLAIPVMARLGLRNGLAGALAAAALTGASLFMVAYSAQARGYGVAIPALILAYAALETALDRPDSRARWALAAAAGFGFFSHLAAGPALALLGVAALGELWRRRGSLAVAVVESFQLFWPAVLAMLPTMALLAAGYANVGTFTIGVFRPFALLPTLGGVLDLETSTFGLDLNGWPQLLFALVILPAAIVAAIVWLAPAERRVAYGVMIFAMPVAAFAFHIPNTHIGRYFFAAAPFLILLAADSFAALWRLGGAARILSAIALAGALFSDGAALARMEAGAAHGWPEALDLVAGSADPSLASNFDFNIGRDVFLHNRLSARPVELTPQENLCLRRPGWFIHQLQGVERPAAKIELGACRSVYVLSDVYGLYLPAQPAWALYRRGD